MFVMSTPNVIDVIIASQQLNGNKQQGFKSINSIDEGRPEGEDDDTDDKGGGDMVCDVHKQNAIDVIIGSQQLCSREQQRFKIHYL